MKARFDFSFLFLISSFFFLSGFPLLSTFRFVRSRYQGIAGAYRFLPSFFVFFSFVSLFLLSRSVHEMTGLGYDW